MKLRFNYNNQIQPMWREPDRDKIAILIHRDNRMFSIEYFKHNDYDEAGWLYDYDLFLSWDKLKEKSNAIGWAQIVKI